MTMRQIEEKQAGIDWRRLLTYAISAMLFSMFLIIGLLSFGSISRQTGSPVTRVKSYYKCRLTGHDRTVIEVNGVTISDELSNNEVSDWAKEHGLTGITPGQLGWELASTETSRGTEPLLFGCAFPHMVPYRLHGGTRTTPNMTPEAALKNYQQHLLDTENNGATLFQDQNDWVVKFLQ